MYIAGLAYRSGNTFRLINVVTLCQARLVPRSVTVFRWVNHLGVEPRPTQPEPAQAE